jgi:hypothetical protein
VVVLVVVILVVIEVSTVTWRSSCLWSNVISRVSCSNAITCSLIPVTLRVLRLNIALRVLLVIWGRSIRLVGILLYLGSSDYGLR